MAYAPQINDESGDIASQRNLPAAQPDPGRYWEHVVDGFDCLTDQLHRLDRAGQLTEWLGTFADCPIRVVLRDTASYAEIRDMLWHPSSLHQPESAIEMATGLLARQAANQSRPPGEPDVIAAEVADLLDDDIPTFVTTPRSDGLAGPRGTRYGEPADLLAGALARWRAADPAMDRRVIRSALLSAYLDDRWRPGRRTAPAWVDGRVTWTSCAARSPRTSSGSSPRRRSTATGRPGWGGPCVCGR